MEIDEVEDSFSRFIESNNPSTSFNGTYGSVFIDYGDLKDYDSGLVDVIIDKPDRYLKILNGLCKELFTDVDSQNVTVRFLNIPILNFRKLSSIHINKMVALRGIVDRVVNVKPMVTQGAFIRRECGHTTYKDQFEQYLLYPLICDGCKKRGGQFFFDAEHSTFIDSQSMSLVERPEDLPAGDIPKRMDILLLRDSIEKVRAGDFVVVNGIVRVKQETQKLRKKVFDIFLEVNGINVESKEITDIEITVEDEMEIRSLAEDPNIYQKTMKSIVPSVYGHERVKEAIMYLLFGGVEKKLPDISIRGEMNVLLIGDPASGKSQLLRGTAKIAPRSIFTSGRGTSAAGLTAAVIKDKDTWVLEAGALVLGDKGFIAIDEMDKMNNDDRVAIHEALEQGTVSIAKAGHKTTLNARCAVLGAANPAFGRWDTENKTIAENLGKFPVTLLSRFDLIFIMTDMPSIEEDERMASHILKLRKEHSKNIDVIPVNLLQKYIGYAKKINPVITDEALEILKDFYVGLRQTHDPEHPIAITARQLESLARIAEAHARIQLRDRILAEDAYASIKIMTKSCEDVKISVKEGEIKSSHAGDNAIAMEALRLLQQDNPLGVEKDIWVQRMIYMKVPMKKTEQIIARLYNLGRVTEIEVNHYRITGQ